MKTIYSEQHIKHQPKFEFFQGNLELHADNSSRINNTINYLKQNNFSIIPPKHFSLNYIKNTHSKKYINHLVSLYNSLSNNNYIYPSIFLEEFFYDTYTPFSSQTHEAALEAVNCALTGADLIKRNKEQVCYVACRPPGHHAMADKAGGYCYFNNAAIAANFLGKTAILDIDLHHGNGTQDIFYDNHNVLTISIHGDPESIFPHFSGFELENNKSNYNFCLPKNTNIEQYLKTLKKSINLIKKFNPDYLIIAAGFDTYSEDPLSFFNLEIPDYKKIGSLINSLNLPTLIVQEGGYNVSDLKKCVYNFLLNF